MKNGLKGIDWKERIMDCCDMTQTGMGETMAEIQSLTSEMSKVGCEPRGGALSVREVRGQGVRE